jgi:hypothetical protein
MVKSKIKNRHSAASLGPLQCLCRPPLYLVIDLPLGTILRPSFGLALGPGEE